MLETRSTSVMNNCGFSVAYWSTGEEQRDKLLRYFRYRENFRVFSAIHELGLDWTIQGNAKHSNHSQHHICLLLFVTHVEWLREHSQWSFHDFCAQLIGKHSSDLKEFSTSIMRYLLVLFDTARLRSMTKFQSHNPSSMSLLSLEAL